MTGTSKTVFIPIQDIISCRTNQFPSLQIQKSTCYVVLPVTSFIFRKQLRFCCEFLLSTLFRILVYIACSEKCDPALGRHIHLTIKSNSGLCQCPDVQKIETDVVDPHVNHMNTISMDGWKWLLTRSARHIWHARDEYCTINSLHWFHLIESRLSLYSTSCLLNTIVGYRLDFKRCLLDDL